MKKYWPWAVLLTVLNFGCGSEKDDLSFTVYADPVRTHAPGNVHFELIRDDGLESSLCTGAWDFGDGITLSGDYEADHRYREAGHYAVSVELNCSGKVGHASADVEVYGSVDLAVAALEARPLDVSTDGNISISFQVSNSADTALQVPVYVDIYLTPTASSTAYLEPGANRMFRHTLQSLPAAGKDGSVEKIELEVPMDASIRTGSYYVTAVVNAEQTVGELSFENNVAFTSQSLTVRNQATDGADFSAIRLQMSPSVTSILTAATAQFDVMNLGSTSAEEFGYEIWLGAKDNGNDMTDAVKVHESTIDGGMSGVERNFKNIQVSIAPAISDPGLYYFWLVLDPSNSIVERDETNNIVRSAAPIQVTNEPVLDADITVEKLTFAPSTATPGGTFSVNLNLYNQGAQPTGPFVCSIFLSEDMSLDLEKDYIVGSINVDDLGPATARPFTDIMETDTGIKAGKYWVYAFCDSSGVISEANEDNNIQRGEKQLTVTNLSDVDLVLGSAVYETPNNLEDGEKLGASVMMCNKGSSAAGPAYVSAMMKNECDGHEFEFSRVLVNGLEAGKCQSVHFSNAMTCDFWCPDYSLTFVADSTMIVAEKDEGNNTIQMKDHLAMSGRDCVCSGDKYEANNAVSSAKKVRSIDAELTVCKDDEDYFLLDIENGENFEVKLTHDLDVSALKMELLQGADVIQTFSGSGTQYLSGIQVLSVDELPLYVHVGGVNPGNANRYQMKLDIYGDSEGIDLAASNLSIEGGELNASDYREVSMKITNIGSVASGPFTIGYYVSQSPEIDDTAWRIARQTLESLDKGALTEAYVSLKLPSDIAGGKYHLIARVDDDESIKDVRRSNNLTRTSAFYLDRSCWDVLDPNEEFDSARKIVIENGHFHHDNLAVCQNNRDIYAFDIENGKTLDITAIADSNGDFDIVLYDQHMNEIASSRTGNREEKIHRDLIVGNQRLYLEVFLLENIYNARETGYSLDIKVSDAPSWNSCSAEFEPNNFTSSAYDLKTAAISGRTAEICPSDDEDFYVISMQMGDRLQLGFETEASGLRAALYRSADLEFVAMLSNPATQTFDYTATKDESYYLRVYTNVSNSEPMSYRMLWLGDEGVDLAVSGLTVSDNVLYSGGDMVVSFDISNQGVEASEYEASVSLTGGQTVVLDHIKGTLDGGEKTHVREKYRIPEQIAGKSRLLVSVVTEKDSSAGNNSASQELTISPACKNDGSEPNNNILQARDLDGEFAGVICPQDEDWFRLETTAHQTVELRFKHDNGDLMLVAYDENGDEYVRSDTASDREVVLLEMGQTYYLQVRGTDSEVANSYVLAVE